MTYKPSEQRMIFIARLRTGKPVPGKMGEWDYASVTPHDALDGLQSVNLEVWDEAVPDEAVDEVRACVCGGEGGRGGGGWCRCVPAELGFT